MRIIFTLHAEDRLVKRKILIEEIVYTIKNPNLTRKKFGKYYYQKDIGRGIIEVCCEHTESDINAEKCKHFWHVQELHS